MQRKYLSNTNLLDGNFTDKDGASLVEVQNLACVRTSNKPPNVVPTDFMRSSRRRTRNTLAESSEKLDLMNILNCFARADCSNSLTSCSPTDRQQWHRDNNTSDVCSFDNSEGPLYNVLLDRFGERKYSTSHPVKTEAWPNKVDKRPKRRTVEQTIDTESADTPGELDLDAQLNAWSAPSNMDKHGLSGDQTVQLLSNEVRHSVVCVEGNQLVWRENNYIIPALNLSEPFRNPPTVLKELVRERLFLLDDHSIAVKVRRNGTQEGTNTNNGTGSANGAPRKSAFVNSKEYLLNKAVQKVDVSDVMSKVPEELQSAELKDSIKVCAIYLLSIHLYIYSFLCALNNIS